MVTSKKRVLKCVSLLLLCLVIAVSGWSQKEEICSPCRKNGVIAASVVAVTGSYFLLDQLWYQDYPRSSFHFFNDNDEWLQMDKAGHAFSCYTIGKYAHDVFHWSGMNEKQSTWIGGSMGLIYMTGIEVLDGKSSQWGFSYGDMIANASGTILFIAQQNFWKEQRIILKFSYHETDFAMLNSDALGHNFQQRILKDYNGQTYWASFNVHSFLASDADFPRWMNVAFGYGATEMLHAEMNAFDVNNFQRKREFYFSFDADLDRVRWKRKWMKQTARILSFIKIPSPTLEVRSDGKVKMHGLFF